MKNQKGMATLAVVSGIVLIIALFAAAVGSSGFSDIKKSQNLFVDAQQRANAKAGLDCAIAVFEQKEVNPKSTDFSMSVFDVCKAPTNSSISFTDNTTHWTLSASSGFAVQSVLVKSGGATAAAFKTSGSLVIDGGNAWIPAKGDKVGTDGDIGIYECIAIIAGGDVTIDVGESSAEFKSALTGTNERCHESFSTHIPPQTDPVTNKFESDILDNQENIDVFQDLFETPKENWVSVKKTFDVTITTGSAISDREEVSNCGSAIKTEVDAGKKKIWVDGDCFIAGLSGAGSGESHPLIVIKNGIVGAKDAFTFQGTIFQFTVDYPEASLADSWGSYQKTDGTGHNLCKEGAMSSLCAELILEYKNDSSKWGKLPFYFHGSYESEGSYLIDVPGSTSLVKGSFKPGYDEGKDPSPGGSGVPRILKGSIHDF
ncbi:hypothetical protein A1OQ_11140 [Enterovibrio norvegicus FF-162]|uniref:Type 4 fimbrial biogenesis protein PilX N-terminal domain-containing protein n=1 Tax=Enterovibrio norvegicus FF-454 TaxID=1185651 RepID=A0A1E5BYA2_9GAMM|nr:hypothetical protein [Enterovibrio norvegicus]OEE58237.1 hypothetical protein A1OK_15825 [Enterovibrio norvegicus FF-454]OEE89836.1 hypothetical protein A1OQ_11140 [Enterovibrio norvegicus FF-162]